MMCGESHSSEDDEESCIFCLIANDRDEETEIIRKTKELVCFRDICPAAPHHYLVIPTQHIESCHSLSKKHIGLVKRMADMGKAVLQDQGITDMKDIRMGFHQPPYTSVDHLHLHVIAPASQISKHMSYKFTPGTYRFVTRVRICHGSQDVLPSSLAQENVDGLCELGVLSLDDSAKRQQTPQIKTHGE